MIVHPNPNEKQRGKVTIVNNNPSFLSSFANDGRNLLHLMLLDVEGKQ